LDDFDCGNADLNEYLKKYARQSQRRMFGTTYVAVSSSHDGRPRVIGYFTLAATSVPRPGLPEDMLRGVPKYQGLPALLLARLAVDKRMHGKKIGEALLSRCFEMCLHFSKLIGARYLIADVRESAITWYQRFNFRQVLGHQNPNWTKI
jgi:GNAT superfamily N-acetyltransferase